MTTDAHACPPAPDTVALEITGLANGPDGIARHEGRVVFVPGVAPGDRVRARLVTDRGAFLRAEVVHRCVDGPARRAAPCPWVGSCGGCPWQHVAYPAQLAAKAANVREVLARIGGVVAARELAIRAAPDEWRYRHRIRLHVGPDGVLGYRRPRSHRVVEIGDCVIADATITAMLPGIRQLVPQLATRLRDLELIANGDGRVVASGAAEGAFAAADDRRVAAFLAEHRALAGVRLTGASWRRDWGDLRLFVRPDDGDPIVQHPGTFSQVNPAANRLLVETVRTLAEPARRVLDLFCGAGNLSLPLARAGIAVTGVDANAGAIADARASAAAGAIPGTRFEPVEALRFLRQQGLDAAELVILDPPRTGAAAEISQLARLRPARIVYVSCDPATLARDVAVLARAGYTVDRVQPLDLFPQTPHVETVLEAVGAID